MNHQKKIIIGSILIAIFVLVVSMSSWYVWNEMYFVDVCSCAVPLPVLIPVLSSIGLLTGTLLYYIFSPNKASPDKKSVDRHSILKLLNGAEREILNTLIEKGGELSQTAIGKETGLSKVVVFRSLEKFRLKGIIKKESKGKTNMIVLDDGIMGIFR